MANGSIVRAASYRLSMIGVLGAAALLVFTTAAATPQPTVKAVSAERLAFVGIRLLAPTSDQHPRIGEAVARQIGAQHGGLGATTPVRETVLARVVNEAQGFDRLCWVVSLDPAGWFKSHGPKGARARSATFFLVFIDAETGTWLFSDAGDNAM